MILNLKIYFKFSFKIFDIFFPFIFFNNIWFSDALEKGFCISSSSSKDSGVKENESRIWMKNSFDILINLPSFKMKSHNISLHPISVTSLYFDINIFIMVFVFSSQSGKLFNNNSIWLFICCETFSILFSKSIFLSSLIWPIYSFIISLL